MTIMLYLWFYNNLGFYPVGISPLCIEVSFEAFKKSQKLKEGETISSATWAFFFLLDEVTYLLKLYSNQYMGL